MKQKGIAALLLILLLTGCTGTALEADSTVEMTEKIKYVYL